MKPNQIIPIRKDEKSIVSDNTQGRIEGLALIPTGYDIRKTPVNYQNSSSYAEKIVHHYVWNDVLKHPASNLKLSFEIAEFLNKYDIVTSSKILLKLARLSADHSGRLSLMVHKVNDTLVIDEFDINQFLLSCSAYEPWPSFLRFLKEMGFGLDFASFSVQKKKEFDLMLNFFYHSLMQGKSQQNLESNQNCQDVEDYEFIGDYLRLGQWNLKDMRLIVGSDLAIFGTNKNPCISLKLNSDKEAINVLTGIDVWLENILNEVPEVAMFYHDEGIIQHDYDFIKTEDIPKISGFDPNSVLELIKNLLAFIQQNSTSEGHTYWLVKDNDAEVIKLYDLTNVCSSQKGTFADIVRECSTDDISPYSIPVISLYFKLAEHRFKELISDNYGSVGLSKKTLVLDIIKLLINCLNVIDSLDKLTIPQYAKEASRDIQKKVIYLLSQVYLLTDTELIRECANELSRSLQNENKETANLAHASFYINTSKTVDVVQSYEKKSNYDVNCRLGDKFLNCFSRNDSSDNLLKLTSSFINYLPETSPVFALTYHKPMETTVVEEGFKLEMTHENEIYLKMIIKFYQEKAYRLWDNMRDAIPATGIIEQRTLIQDCIASSFIVRSISDASEFFDRIKSKFSCSSSKNFTQAVFKCKRILFNSFIYLLDSMSDHQTKMNEIESEIKLILDNVREVLVRVFSPSALETNLLLLNKILRGQIDLNASPTDPNPPKAWISLLQEMRLFIADAERFEKGIDMTTVVCDRILLSRMSTEIKIYVSNHILTVGSTYEDEVLWVFEKIRFVFDTYFEPNPSDYGSLMVIMAIFQLVKVVCCLYQSKCLSESHFKTFCADFFPTDDLLYDQPAYIYAMNLLHHIISQKMDTNKHTVGYSIRVDFVKVANSYSRIKTDLIVARLKENPHNEMTLQYLRHFKTIINHVLEAIPITYLKTLQNCDPNDDLLYQLCELNVYHIKCYLLLRINMRNSTSQDKAIVSQMETFYDFLTQNKPLTSPRFFIFPFFIQSYLFILKFSCKDTVISLNGCHDIFDALKHLLPVALKMRDSIESNAMEQNDPFVQESEFISLLQSLINNILDLVDRYKVKITKNRKQTILYPKLANFNLKRKQLANDFKVCLNYFITLCRLIFV